VPTQVSYLEIYNEQLYDLLSDAPGTSDSLAVLEDANNNTYVSWHGLRASLIRTRLWSHLPTPEQPPSPISPRALTLPSAPRYVA
jgi:hypothetical protein